MGKEPEQRTQHYHMKMNPTTTTAEKEDDKDSTAIQQQATTTAEKDDVTDSTADNTTTNNQSIISTAAKEDDADSTAKMLSSNSPWKNLQKEADETDTTTTMLWLTASTCENRNKTRTNTLGHWVVPNHIGVIKKDLGPCEVFDFMGDVSVSRKQTLPKPGEETRHIEDRSVQGLYMDTHQDYSSMKRKIFKPARK